MCGINLVVHPQAEERHLLEMQDALRHRGPDSRAFRQLRWNDASLWLGNTRLKVQGLGDFGNQPMQCDEGGKPGSRYTLCYNGELYNVFELRNELLAKGFTFHSQTDTEVLLYGLIVWGKELLSRINGMFAFAFFDAAENKLLLARDRQGMKPLYYYRSANQLFVASELRSLFASGLLEKKLNEQQLEHYLHFRYAKPPQTFYEGVQQLLPGQLLELKNVNDPAEPQLWAQQQNQPEAESKSAEQLLNELEETLTDAAFRHLQSDRPVALALSGGVDSTLLLALLRKEASYQLPVCYGIGTDAETAKASGNSDLYWAEKAAKQYEAPFEQLILSDELLNDFPDFVAGFDQPIADSASLFIRQLCTSISGNGQVVVLNGAGADEYFAGYNRHTAWLRYIRNPRQLSRLVKLGAPLLSLIPSGLSPALSEKKRLLKRLTKSLTPDEQQTFANMLSLQPPVPAGLPDELAPLKKDPEGWLKAILAHDQQHYLVQDLLMLNDTLGMQQSLEIRMPYLDREVVTFAEQQPALDLLQGGRKWMLKALLSNLGGAEYAKRQKQGFSAPFGIWIRQGKTEALWHWFNEPASAAARYLPAAEIRQQLEAHKAGKANAGEYLFGVAVLACWLNQQFTS